MARDVIRNFPDGVWAIRWVDMVEPGIGGTGTPGISVQLIRLPAKIADKRPSRISKENAENVLRFGTVDHPLHPEDSYSSIYGCRVSGNVVIRACQTGVLPRLAVGDVFRDGQKIGTLPLQIQTFELKRIPIEYDYLSAEADFPTKLPGLSLDFLKVNWDHKVVPSKIYSLHALSKSNCLVLAEGEQVLVLPCFEVFRSYYGVGTDLANAFLTETWNEAASKLAVLPETVKIAGDGSADAGAVALGEATKLVVKLRKQLSDESAMMLAHFLLDPVGRKAAAAIFPETLHPPDEHREQRSVAVRIPFGWSRFKVKVRGIMLRDDGDGGARSFLGLQIIGTSWLGPAEVEVLAPEQAKSTSEPAGEKEVSNTESLIPPAEPAPVLVAPNIDAGTGSEVQISLAGSKWFRRPNIVKKKYELPPDDRKKPIKVTYTTSTVASAGNRHGGTRGVPHVRYEPNARGKASDTFEAVVKLFEALKADAVIEQWEPVTPEGGEFFLGNLPVWPLIPLSGSKWVYEHGKFWRTALVCRFKVDVQVGYWIEIDVRKDKPDNTYRSLLIDIGDMDAQEIIEEVLKHACEHGRRGVWYREDEKDESMLPPLAPGIIATQLYTHTVRDRVLRVEGAARKIRALFSDPFVQRR